jgi:hypothetical protein
MSDSDVIREFLIGLGVQDNATAKLKSVTRTAVVEANLISHAMEGAMKSFGNLLLDISKQMDTMFYMSQRTGATVAGIQALGYASERMGSSVDDAKTSLENFARFLRLNPGGTSLLKGYGVQTTDLQGKLLKTEDLYKNFIKTIQNNGMPYGTQMQIMGMFGVSEAQFRMSSKEVEELEKKFKAMRDAAGINPEQYARDAKDIMNSWNDIGAAITTVFDRVKQDLAADAKDGLRDFADYMMHNAGPIADEIGKVAKEVEEWVKQTFRWLTQGDNFKKSIEGIEHPFIVLGNALKRVRDFLKEIDELFNKFRLAGQYLGVDKAISGATADRAESQKQYEAAGGDNGGIWGGIKSGARKAWNAVTGGGGDSGGASIKDAARGRSGPAKNGNLTSNQREAYQAAKAEGLNDTAARALVANMTGEGLAVPHDYHWDGKHFSQGIVQWDPSRSNAIKAQFGKLPRDMSVAEQTKAAIWEINNNPRFASTKAAMAGTDPNAMIDKLVRNYESPSNPGLHVGERIGTYNRLPGLDVKPDADTSSSPRVKPVGPAPNIYALPNWGKNSGAVGGAIAGTGKSLGGIKGLSMGSQPLGVSPSQQTANDNSSSTIHYNAPANITVQGVVDPMTAASQIEKSLDNIGQKNTDRLRNMTGTVQ